MVGIHFSAVTHPKHSSKVRYKEHPSVMLAEGYADRISITTAYFIKPRCFKNS